MAIRARTMDYPPRFGLDHPTWDAPTNFYYASEAAARDSIERAYGPDSGHVVVCLVLTTTPAPTANGDDRG